MDVKRRLIFQALVAMQAIWQASDSGPVAPSPSHAFVMAYLSAQNAVTRRHAVTFWREMQDGHERAYSQETGRLLRKQALASAIDGMIVALGLPNTPAMHAAMRAGVNADPRENRAACAAFWSSVDEIGRLGAAKQGHA